MRNWTPPAEHRLLWWDDGGACCCGGGAGDGEERGGEGGGRAGTEGRDVQNSSMYSGSNSLRRDRKSKGYVNVSCLRHCTGVENCF